MYSQLLMFCDANFQKFECDLALNELNHTPWFRKSTLPDLLFFKICILLQYALTLLWI